MRPVRGFSLGTKESLAAVIRFARSVNLVLLIEESMFSAKKKKKKKKEQN